MTIFRQCQRGGCEESLDRQWNAYLCEGCWVEYVADTSGVGMLLWIRDAPPKKKLKKRSKNQKSISVSGALHRQIKAHVNQTGESASALVTRLSNSHINGGELEPVKKVIPPRVYLRCRAPAGKDIDLNRDIFFGVGSDIQMPVTQSLQMKVTVEGEQLKVTAELNLSDLCLDMPAILIDEDGNKTVGTVQLDASSPSGERALNPMSDFDSLRINGREDIYVASIEFTCLPSKGGDHVTQLVVHTIKPKGKMTTDEPN